jgi:hypothetical protein
MRYINYSNESTESPSTTINSALRKQDQLSKSIISISIEDDPRKVKVIEEIIKKYVSKNAQ